MEARRGRNCRTGQSQFPPSPQEEEEIYLKVTKTVALKVKRSETIKSLKAMLLKKEHVSEMQELFLEGDRLGDDQTLVDCGIKKNSTLHLFVNSETEMKLFVKLPSEEKEEKDVMLEVKPYETIQNVKIMIQSKEGIPSDQFSLFYSGKKLENNGTLASFKIKTESTLQLVFNPRDMLSVRLKIPDGGIKRLEVKIMYTVWDLKAIISSMTGFSASALRLIYKEHELEEGYTLAHYDIKEESTIEILPAPFSIDIRYIEARSGSPGLFSIAVEPGDTGKDLKKKLVPRFNVPVNYQTIVYDLKIIEDGQELAKCNIRKDSTVHVVLRDL